MRERAVAQDLQFKQTNIKINIKLTIYHVVNSGQLN